MLGLAVECICIRTAALVDTVTNKRANEVDDDLQEKVCTSYSQ